MKRLLFICALVFLASAAQAQTPVGLAPVPRPVFTQNGAPLVNGCLFSFAAGTSTPLATFADSTGTVSNPNPTILDANGTPSVSGNEVGIYLSSANYKFQLKAFGGTNCASGASVWTADNINAASFLNLPNTWTATQSFNAGAGNTDVAAGNINGMRYVDSAGKFTTPQAAIADCPATDCWVLVKPGTYTQPTNLRSNLRVSCFTFGVPSATITAATNLVWGSPPADNKCIFTGTTNLTLANIWNLMVEGVTFDFGGNNVGIVFSSGVFNNTFDIVIQNSGTGTALTMNSGVISGSSTVGNIFRNLFIFNAGKGIVFNGSAPGVIANNRFMYTLINNISTRAIEFLANADTNSFDMTFIGGLANAAQAVAFNTSSPAADTGCNDNVFRHLITDAFNPNSYTGTLIQINKSSGNTIMAWSVGGGITVGGGTELAIANSPTYTVTYASDFSVPANSNITRTALQALTLKKGSGAGNYVSASTSYVQVDATNLLFAVIIPTGYKLAIVARGDVTSATAAVAVGIAIADGGAVVVETALTPVVAGTVTAPFSLAWVITGDGLSHSVDLRYKTSNAADSVTIANPTATATPTMIFTLMPSN